MLFSFTSQAQLINALRIRWGGGGGGRVGDSGHAHISFVEVFLALLSRYSMYFYRSPTHRSKKRAHYPGLTSPFLKLRRSCSGLLAPLLISAASCLTYYVCRYCTFSGQTNNTRDRNEANTIVHSRHHLHLIGPLGSCSAKLNSGTFRNRANTTKVMFKWLWYTVM